jgi:transcription antitermination factor NusG
MLMATPTDAIEPRPDRDYFVMLTEPNREMTAQANLIIRHVPFYLPTIFRAARISARAQAARKDHPDIPIALFPGMIFIACEIADCLTDLIRTAPGMRMQHPFLKFGADFARVRPLAMQAILEIEAAERARYFARKRKRKGGAWEPTVGQEVRILVDEVLAGFTGRVSEIDSKGRIAIFTELMKRTVRVHVTADQIEPV